MNYVFSTTDTIVYRFPTHVNELVLDRVGVDGHRGLHHRA